MNFGLNYTYYIPRLFILTFDKHLGVLLDTEIKTRVIG